MGDDGRVLAGHGLDAADGAQGADAFHEPFDAREWLLLDQRVPWAGKGRFYGCGNVFTSNGALVASFTQEGLLRALSEHQGKGATL